MSTVADDMSVVARAIRSTLMCILRDRMPTDRKTPAAAKKKTPAATAPATPKKKSPSATAPKRTFNMSYVTGKKLSDKPMNS
jgi:hypothetical protein